MRTTLLAGGTPDLVICVPGSLTYIVAGDGTLLARASDVAYLATWGLTPAAAPAPEPAPLAESSDAGGGFLVDA